MKPKSGTVPNKDLLHLDGYELHLNKHYEDPDIRGVAIYTSKDLNATVKERPADSTVFKDSIWLHVDGINNQNLLIGCIYRSGTPLKAANLDPDLHEMIKQMVIDTNYKQVLILGDFNHPHITWSPAPVLTANHTNANHPDVKFVEMINDCMLHQHVSEPTRDRGDQRPTVDDLIFTTDPDTFEDLQHDAHL